MELYLRRIPDFALAALAVWAHWRLFAWWAPGAGSKRMWLERAAWAGGGLAVLGLVLGFHEIQDAIPLWALPAWIRAAGFAWSIGAVIVLGMEAVWRRMPRPAAPDPVRRRLLLTAKSAAMAAPAAAAGYGLFIGRSDIRTREVDVRIPGLPKDLDGLRIVQLTDIHLGPFFEARELDRAVDMANEANAHVAVVTGDLISHANDPVELCLERLRRLRATAGIHGCLGNHEVFAECEEFVTNHGARLGLRFLRNEPAELRFGAARLNLVGVDYQKLNKPYLTSVAGMARTDACNVLLSHNPDVFEKAASLGYHLTIAGHTHGGQVTVEQLNQHVNVARFYTPYVQGLYEQRGKSIYVSRGLGTVGIPVRLGAPPEVSLIRLCAT